MDILIVGAGLGGLTAAAVLQQRGHRVRVFEQAPQLGEVGAGIQLSANAMKVLDVVGIRPALLRAGVRPQSWDFRRFDTGELLHRLPLGDAHEDAFGAPYLQLHRADLHAALQQVVLSHDTTGMMLDARAIAITEREDCVQVFFDGGRVAEADLVIGADGLRSLVRRHVIGDDEPQFTGQVAWRCTVPAERIAPQGFTPDRCTVWCGPGRHAAIYALRVGRLVNFVGCVERPDEGESWTARRPWAELDADYGGWHPDVRAVIEQVDRDQCFRWSLNNRQPSLRWSSERITLLGDAVHATLPYLAQGAALAIEDAAVLVRALELPLPLPDQLRRYESARAPRAARVVQESSRMAALYHLADEAAMRDSFSQEDLTRSRNEWIYAFDPWKVPLS